MPFILSDMTENIEAEAQRKREIHSMFLCSYAQKSDRRFTATP